MSRVYSPDRWAIIKTSDSKGEFYKILGSWYGGYLGSDGWKLSSGILHVVDMNTYWEFPQESGSTYCCHKGSYGMSGYTAGVYSHWQEQLKDAKVGKLEVMDENFDIAAAFQK